MTSSATSLASRAADAARRGRLYEAIGLYGDAVRATSATAQRVRLVEDAAVVARHWIRPLDVEPLIAHVLEDPLTATERGRVWFSRALVLGYAGDPAGRTAALQEARASFAGEGDDLLAAKTLGALSIPVGDDFTIDERVELGREGIALARRAGDPEVLAHCSGNLAGAVLASGDVAGFDRWESAVAALEAVGTRRAREEATRYRSQWAGGALAFGDYARAARVIAQGAARTRHPFWSMRFQVQGAMLAWRTGDWDRAEALAVEALAGTDLPGVLPARAVLTAIRWERQRRPGAAPSILFPPAREDLWPAAFIASIAAWIRDRRREPFAVRGLQQIVELAARTRNRIGWYDLPLVAAGLDPDLCRSMLEVVVSVPPAGRRGAVAVEATRSRLAADEDGLVAAGEAFARLDEPFEAARCYADAAQVRAGPGVEWWVAAAALFRQVGAERSLAELLRRAPRVRALSAFDLPREQRRAPAAGLTRREGEVARLAAQAYTAAEIAGALGVSEATVRTHLARVKNKLGARRKADLVRLLARDPG